MKDLTLKMGNQEDLEAERLKAWANMTHQQRLDALMALLEVWWPHDRRLERTYRIVTIP